MTKTARHWTTAMWSLEELLVLDRLLREAGRAIILTDDRTQWQHPRKWTQDPQRPGHGVPLEQCPEDIKLKPGRLALVWRNEAHQRPLSFHHTYVTSVVRAELSMDLRLVSPWHRAVATSDSYPALLLTAFEHRHGGALCRTLGWRGLTFDRGRELAQAAADWEDEQDQEVIDENYCRVHDLFDCPYAHGPALSDLNY